MARSSPIHGRGLYALVDFKRGDVVVSWDNTIPLTQDDFDKLPTDEKHFVDFQGGKILLVGKPERFVNHSCDANTVPGNKCDIAARDIRAGEEITADYSHFFIPAGQFQCACGSPRCRVTVTGK